MSMKWTPWFVFHWSLNSYSNTDNTAVDEVADNNISEMQPPLYASHPHPPPHPGGAPWTLSTPPRMIHPPPGTTRWTRVRVTPPHSPVLIGVATAPAGPVRSHCPPGTGAGSLVRRRRRHGRDHVQRRSAPRALVSQETWRTTWCTPSAGMERTCYRDMGSWMWLLWSL